MTKIKFVQNQLQITSNLLKNIVIYNCIFYVSAQIKFKLKYVYSFFKFLSHFNLNKDNLRKIAKYEYALNCVLSEISSYPQS